MRARVIVITRSAVVTDHWESQGVLSGGDGKPYTPPLWLAQCTNRHAIDYKCGTRHNTTTTPHYAAPHHTQHAHTHAPTVGVPMPIHETCLELAEYVRRRGALSRVTNFVAREGEDAARPIAGERHAMYFVFTCTFIHTHTARTSTPTIITLTIPLTLILTLPPPPPSTHAHTHRRLELFLEGVDKVNFFMHPRCPKAPKLEEGWWPALRRHIKEETCKVGRVTLTLTQSGRATANRVLPAGPTYHQSGGVGMGVVEYHRHPGFSKCGRSQILQRPNPAHRYWGTACPWQCVAGLSGALVKRSLGHQLTITNTNPTPNQGRVKDTPPMHREVTCCPTRTLSVQVERCLAYSTQAMCRMQL